jgi:small redox-active disulfide protein 2
MRKVQILGTGCAKCRTLLENAEAACRSLGIDHEIEKVDDINRILDYNVMMTPALVVDGEVKSVGKALSQEDIMDILSDNRQREK